MNAEAARDIAIIHFGAIGVGLLVGSVWGYIAAAIVFTLFAASPPSVKE